MSTVSANTALTVDSKQLVTARQLLALLLEQQQWDRSVAVAEWLAARDDVAAGVVRVELMVIMARYKDALKALACLPVSIRKVPRVMRLEARIVYSSGYPELAKQIYLSTLDSKKKVQIG